MTDAVVMSVMRDSLMTIMIVSAPMLGVGMFVGLIISIFQTTTSIQEQTLTFVPKIVAIFSSDVIPFRIKALVSFLITLVIFPVVAAKGYHIPNDMGAYFLLVLQ